MAVSAARQFPSMTRKAALAVKVHICSSSELSKPQLKMNILEWAFGRQMTPAERLRKHQRALEKTQRELDRERVKLENQEKKLIVEIKKSAKNGQMGACKIQAKDLVRTRRYAIIFACTYMPGRIALGRDPWV